MAGRSAGVDLAPRPASGYMAAFGMTIGTVWGRIAEERQHGMPMDDLFDEAERQLNICNACRYCAGYRPVWPALELRRELATGDITHLANLCHDCRDCFTACMYTERHVFASTATTRRADVALIWALLALNATGLAVLALRTTPLFGSALIVHLLTVVVAFAIAPYTKFVHRVYRMLAMVKDNLERSRPVPSSRHP